MTLASSTLLLSAVGSGDFGGRRNRDKGKESYIYTSVDEGDAEGEKNPANDVVADPSG